MLFFIILIKEMKMVNTFNYYKKGNDLFEAALKIIASKNGDSVEIITAFNKSIFTDSEICWSIAEIHRFISVGSVGYVVCDSGEENVNHRVCHVSGLCHGCPGSVFKL